jgi:hypothetical protein
MNLVYRYGIAAPHEGADLVEAQLRAAHEYHCALVRIERERRAQERAVRSESSAELRDAEAAVQGMDAACAWLAAEISLARKAARKRAETAAMRFGIAAARAKLKQAKGDLFALRERLRGQCPECRAAKSEIMPCDHVGPEARALRLALDAVDLRAREKIREAYGQSPAYWGTKLVVDKAMAASRAMPIYAKDGTSPNDPRFPRFDGGGCLAVQFQNGLSGQEAFADDDRLQLTRPAWPEEWLASQTLSTDVGRPGKRPPGVRPDGTRAPASKPDGTPARWVRDRAVRHGQLRMCVATEGRGKPLWASWRLDYDRPLPEGATISWACVYRRMRGPHAEWSLCLTVDVPAPAVADAPKPGAAAVDVGWRQMPCSRGAKCHGQRTDCHELRVAGWQDDAGKKGELRLNAQDLYALRSPSEIRSERDRSFDRIKAQVARWIRESADAPQWMRQAAAHMHSWRRQARMVALLTQWSTERLQRGADEEIVLSSAQAWASADRHWWATERARDVWAHRRRRERYRVFAAQMAEEYGTVILEQFDLRKVAQRADVGEDEPENETAHGNRQLAAVSELRLAICHAALTRSCEVVAVDAADTTRTCPSCGLVADRGQEDTVRLVCECGHAWDQDTDGAALMLLARWRERPGDAKIVGGARAVAIAAEKKGKRGDKHARAKRMGAAKRARLETARKETGTPA